MLEESEALARIMALVPPPTPVELPVDDALGHWISRDLFAALAQPAFDNSAMDGYALHAADCERAGHTVRVTGEQPAGVERGLGVRPGECARVFTGAPLPRDTAAVIMQEDTVPGPAPDTIVLTEAAAAGEFIRRRGTDLAAGQRIAAAGARVSPQLAGLLAGQGRDRVPVGLRPATSILCTGDELILPGQPLTAPGQIYASNGVLLSALLRDHGFPATHATLPDRLDVLTAALERSLAECPVTVLAGGVSVGDHDLVKPALERLGIPLDFWRIRVKPGKPFLFTRHGDRLIFGLPGNPVSAMVTAVLFVLPALRRLAGCAPAACAPVRVPVRLTHSLTNRGDRPHYLRGWRDAAAATFTPAGRQESHATGGLSQSNALVRLDPDTTAPADAICPCITWGW